MTISTLIDKQDTFELIRDRIGAILASEVASQMLLATQAGKDPSLWKMQVFLERSSPWEKWLNIETGVEVDTSPIINISYDNSGPVERASDTVHRQQIDAVYNIDCVAIGLAAVDKAADKEAAFALHRALRLVRNILMSAEYTYLSARGLVGKRWIRSISTLSPDENKSSTHKIYAGRIVLAVQFNEFSPQVEEAQLEGIDVEIINKEDGEVLVNLSYDF